MNIFGYRIERNKREVLKTETKPPSRKTVVADLPKNQVSSPPVDGIDVLTDIKSQNKFIDRDYVKRIIPQIRKLAKINPDINITMKDRRELANTGHKIAFDKAVPHKQQIQMRDHLMFVRKSWSKYTAGMDGMVNKIMNQASISGAIAVEWVPNNDLTGIRKLVLVNPESIVFRYIKSKKDFLPYQVITDNYRTGTKRYRKLNPNTFMYISMNGDTEIPYGDPEFMSAINNITSQRKMTENIEFIIHQLGVMGFFEALIEKPGQQDNESDEQYVARLTSLLTTMKTKLNDSMREGITVGYKEDHEFNFHSTTKDIRGVQDIFNLNEVQISNGLGHPASFLGVPSSATETQTTVLFSKIVSQLTTIQQACSTVLEYGYALELRLAGYSFKHLRVLFKPSTITDALKQEQANEYKIRNNRTLYADGIISQHDYAWDMDIESPDQDEPRVPIDADGQQDDVTKKRDTKKKITDADKKTADKRKINPKDNAKNQ